MNTAYNIVSHCGIRSNTLMVNGEVVYSNPSVTFPEFLKAAYKNDKIGYPKFFKMDNLSKLAFLASEMILKEKLKEDENIALVFANNSASLDTDRKHQQSINDPSNYYPSPSVFVYTLPNICLGEISIRHKLLSENSFFIFDSFKAEHLHGYAQSLLNLEKADKVLCGWVNYDTDNQEAFVYLVSRDSVGIKHEINEINQLYTSLWGN